MESPLLELETIPAPALFTLLLDHSLVDCELVAADGAVLHAHRFFRGERVGATAAAPPALPRSTLALHGCRGSTIHLH